MVNIKKALSGTIVAAIMLLLLTSCAKTSDSVKVDTDKQDAYESTSTAEIITTTDNETCPELKIEISSDSERIYESMDYVFVPDNEAVGTWKVTGTILNIDDFDPSVRSNTNELIWQSATFFGDGTAVFKFL